LAKTGGALVKLLRRRRRRAVFIFIFSGGGATIIPAAAARRDQRGALPLTSHAAVEFFPRNCRRILCPVFSRRSRFCCVCPRLSVCAELL